MGGWACVWIGVFIHKLISSHTTNAIPSHPYYPFLPQDIYPKIYLYATRHRTHQYHYYPKTHLIPHNTQYPLPPLLTSPQTTPSHHYTHQFYPKTYLYATPTLVAGLLSGALLMAIAYTGAAILLSLQVCLWVDGWMDVKDLYVTHQYVS